MNAQRELSEWNLGVQRAREQYELWPTVTDLLVADVETGGVQYASTRWNMGVRKIRVWLGALPPLPRPSCGTRQGIDQHSFYCEAPCECCQEYVLRARAQFASVLSTSTSNRSPR